MNISFLNTAKVTLILVYLVIIAGAVVRMTGSGMGCPDWPKCFGYYIPPTEQSQLEWQPNTTFSKGQIIIVEESLQVAKQDFTTTDTFNNTYWEPYTKHDYATFNATHTWVEYINRLFGALAGLATLLLGFLSIKFWKQQKSITLLSWLTVFGMGFQAWLGKTVVDSNLAPFKITIHMVMALVIVAMLLYIIYKVSPKIESKSSAKAKIFTTFLYAALALTLLQVVLGTQVRQFVDEQIKLVGEQKALWLQNPTLSFYIHRTFSIIVVLLNVWLFAFNKKYRLGFSKLFWVLVLIALEVLSGIAMYYFEFPFSTQTIHIVMATLLFGVQFYLILEANSLKINSKK